MSVSSRRGTKQIRPVPQYVRIFGTKWTRRLTPTCARLFGLVRGDGRDETDRFIPRKNQPDGHFTTQICTKFTTGTVLCVVNPEAV